VPKQLQKVKVENFVIIFLSGYYNFCVAGRHIIISVRDIYLDTGFPNYNF